MGFISDIQKQAYHTKRVLEKQRGASYDPGRYIPERNNVSRVAVNNERRSETRYKLNCDCTIIIDGVEYDANVNDISFSGASIVLKNYNNTNIFIGQNISFTFRKNNYHEITMKAEIRNVAFPQMQLRLGLLLLDGRMDIWQAIVRTLY